MAEGIGLPPEVTGASEDTGEVRQVKALDGGETVMDVKFKPLGEASQAEAPEPAVGTGDQPRTLSERARLVWQSSEIADEARRRGVSVEQVLSERDAKKTAGTSATTPQSGTAGTPELKIALDSTAPEEALTGDFFRYTSKKAGPDGRPRIIIGTGLPK